MANKDISTDMVKELRDQTGVSIMQCKKALEESGGDMEKAVILLRKKGAATAAKKADRQLKAGAVGSYTHTSGTVGAMVLLSCETDFVSNNQEFQTLARDIAMQVTATAPEYLSYDQVPDAAKQTAREVFHKEVEGKPKEMREKIMEGKLASYFKEKALLDQPFIKNGEMSVRELIHGAVQKFGEKIELIKFVRIEL